MIRGVVQLFGTLAMLLIAIVGAWIVYGVGSAIIRWAVRKHASKRSGSDRRSR